MKVSGDMPPSKGVMWSMGSGPAGVACVAAADAEVLVDFMVALWRQLQAVVLIPLNENRPRLASERSPHPADVVAS
jgi:hypothetical protein